MDPWRYRPIIMESTTSALHKKEYCQLKTKDFYNIDHSVIPKFIEPAKLLLYRYLRYEPYFYEMFNLNPEIHPYHPLQPSAEEIQKLTNKYFYTTRNPVTFPLEERKAKKKRNKSLGKCKSAEKYNTAYMMAGLSETESHLSPDDIPSDWSSDDFETGSLGTLRSWKFKAQSVSGRRERELTREAGQRQDDETDPLEGIPNVKELWQRIRRSSSCRPSLGPAVRVSNDSSSSEDMTTSDNSNSGSPSLNYF